VLNKYENKTIYLCDFEQTSLYKCKQPRHEKSLKKQDANDFVFKLMFSE